MTQPQTQPRRREETESSPPSPHGLEDLFNSLLCQGHIAGYALVQPTGHVLVAFGCLFEGFMVPKTPPTPSSTPDSMITALLIDPSQTSFHLKGKKMHIVRREPAMLFAVEATSSPTNDDKDDKDHKDDNDETSTTRHPVACSVHCIQGNNILLVAYHADHKLALPRVLQALALPPQVGP
jgi:hypothetical protein